MLLDGEILEIRIETLSSCLIRRDDHSFESEMRDNTQIGHPDIRWKRIFTLKVHTTWLLSRRVDQT